MTQERPTRRAPLIRPSSSNLWTRLWEMPSCSEASLLDINFPILQLYAIAYSLSIYYRANLPSAMIKTPVVVLIGNARRFPTGYRREKPVL